MNEQIHQELAKLQQELSRLDDAVKHIENAKKLAVSIIDNGQTLQAKYDKHIEEVKRLISTSFELTGRVESLVEKIEKVDFPERLNKLDMGIAEINLGLQNMQMRLAGLMADLKNYMADSQKKLSSKVEKNTDTIKTLKIMVVLLIILCFGSLLIEFLKLVAK
jgi:chromosome segregation ATPase